LRLKSFTQQARRLLIGSLLLFAAACAPVAIATSTALPIPQVAEASATPTATAAPTALVARTDIETYLVVEGDTLSGIAAQFNLQPQTVLWANYDLLFDSPDFLLPGMVLTILPVDGVYHQVGGGDSVESLATFFAAEQRAIIDWPANQIDPTNPVIFAGQWVLVPGGQRQLRRRVMPNLPSLAMAVDPLEFGSGACPVNIAAAMQGDGNFAWPVSARAIVAEDYWLDAHPAIDITARIGEDVLAADDGVVVFSGWSNLGYGLMILMDHGNGDFTLYGGLGEVTAPCGQSLAEGQPVGKAGSTGHPAAPYLHFEIRRGDEFLDPLEELP
jgi:murein DD-endopeptidase MepM/ murein hydrolase activator NlpD